MHSDEVRFCTSLAAILSLDRYSGHPLAHGLLLLMLRNFLLGATASLPALMLLPAVAGEAPLGPAAGMELITLAEANAVASTVQQADSQPTMPHIAAPGSAPSPWAGTLEIYGFMPLRATTSIRRGATQRELPGQIRERIADRLRQEIGERVGDATNRELLALAAQGL